MGAKTKIEWTRGEDGSSGATWNPIRARNLATGKIGWHCEHVSEGCRFCYAERLNLRLGTGLQFKPGRRGDYGIFLDEKMLLAPLRWKKPRRIFVNSMSDTFAEFVKDEWIDRMFAVMALCPQHTFQCLTKRPKRMRHYCTDSGVTHRIASAITCVSIPLEWPLQNCWLGTSCEDQTTADERIPLLLETPAAVRFVSLEPLLGPIKLRETLSMDRHSDWLASGLSGEDGLDWVIVGGESGPHARPMHPQWVRNLRDQCATAGVAFFLKQWGEWAPGECGKGPPTRTECVASFIAGSWNFGKQTPRESAEGHHLDEPDVYRLGKIAAGRLLDGIEHNGFPSPRC